MIAVVGMTDEHYLVQRANLQRVWVPTTGEILDELVTERRARGLVAMHNEEHPGETAVATPYEALEF